MKSPVRMVCETNPKTGKKQDWLWDFEEGMNLAKCRWTCDKPIQAAQFRNRRDPKTYAVLHPSSKAGQAGKWQLSLFDEQGAYGDVPGPSCDGART